MRKNIVNITDIEVGKSVPWDIYNLQGKLLLRSGFPIEYTQQLEKLNGQRLYFIEDLLPGEKGIPLSSSPFELRDNICRTLSQLLFSEPVKELFSMDIISLCNMIQQSFDQKPNESLSTIFVEKQGKRLIMHAIDSAFLCEAVASRLGCSLEERTSLLAAALTMNVSMIPVQQDKLFLEQADLSDEERQVIHKHPERGREMLGQFGVTNSVWIDIVLQHHELLNGKGFPQGLQEGSISQLTRILTLADFLCAKVSCCGRRDTIIPNTDLREIFVHLREACFDQDIAMVLIKELGLYPPGSLVQLANGEIAVVTHRGEQIHCPIAHSLVRKSGISISPPMLWMLVYHLPFFIT